MGDNPHSAKDPPVQRNLSPGDSKWRYAYKMAPLPISISGHCGIQENLDDDRLASVGTPNQDIVLVPLSKSDVLQIPRKLCRMTGHNKRFNAWAEESIDYPTNPNFDSPRASSLPPAHDTVLHQSVWESPIQNMFYTEFTGFNHQHANEGTQMTMWSSSFRTVHSFHKGTRCAL